MVLDGRKSIECMGAEEIFDYSIDLLGWDWLGVCNTIGFICSNSLIDGSIGFGICRS